MTRYIRVYWELLELHFNASLSSNCGETDLKMHGTRIWECNIFIWKCYPSPEKLTQALLAMLVKCSLNIATVVGYGFSKYFFLFLYNRGVPEDGVQGLFSFHLTVLFDDWVLKLWCLCVILSVCLSFPGVFSFSI